MSKVTFEMDGDEYCLLMKYKQLDSIENWQKLKELKDNCPVIYYYSYRQSGDRYYSEQSDVAYQSRDKVFEEIINENRKLNNKLNLLKTKVDVVRTSVYSFRERIKILFTGKIDWSVLLLVVEILYLVKMIIK